MTQVRASCRDCGDVMIPARDFTARVCADTGSCAYLFRCPRCGAVIVKGCERRTVELLVEGGAVKQLWALPLELAEQHSGAPIDHEDLLDFHQALYDEATFRRGLDEVFGEPA